MRKRKTKTTEITVEKSDVFVVRKPGRLILAWCAQCAAEVRLCTPEEASALTGVSARVVYRWAEAGKVHYTETAEGLLLVCLNSVS